MLGKSEVTIRRMIRTGKLPAHRETIAPWGPTWVVDEAEVARILHHDQALVEVLPPDYEPPDHLIREVREGLTTLNALIREGDQGIREELHTSNQSLRAEVAALRSELERLQTQISAKRSWWPWAR